jgi:large subunit ribosomal protein L17
MKKRIFGRKLNRTKAHRESMFRNMVSSLIEHERIVTTVPKAKELSRLADRMITLAKNQDLYNLRRAAAVVRGDWNLTKLFDVLGPRYQLREGGYTRVLKLSKNRAGDNAPMAVIEYVDRPGEIRAARPPNVLQVAAVKSQETGMPLQQILKEMGIPTIDELVGEEEKQEMEMELNK